MSASDVFHTAARAAGGDVVVMWNAPTKGRAASVSLEFQDGTAYFSSPAHARALGITLIEAAALAVEADQAAAANSKRKARK